MEASKLTRGGVEYGDLAPLWKKLLLWFSNPRRTIGDLDVPPIP